MSRAVGGESEREVAALEDSWPVLPASGFGSVQGRSGASKTLLLQSPRLVPETGFVENRVPLEVGTGWEAQTRERSKLMDATLHAAKSTVRSPQVYLNRQLGASCMLDLVERVPRCKLYGSLACAYEGLRVCSVIGCSEERGGYEFLASVFSVVASMIDLKSQNCHRGDSLVSWNWC